MIKVVCLSLVLLCVGFQYTSATFISNGVGGGLLNSLLRGVPGSEIGPGYGSPGLNRALTGPGGYGGRCPLCDSSVFEYCSHKLLHDACCCNGGIGIPYNCQISDCSYLHSNSCYEHSLITTCCCNNPYQYHRK